MVARVMAAERCEPKFDLMLLVILALGLLFRVVLLYTTQDTGLMISDERDYQLLAHNIFKGDGFALEPGKLTSVRPPLYPVLAALLWTFTGTESVVTIRIAQVALSLGNVWLLYRLGLLLFDRPTALLAAAVLSFYPSLLAFNSFILTEVLFTFLLTLIVLGIVLVIQGGGAWVALGAGIALGLGALTRSVLWPFPVVLLPLVLLTAPGTWSRRLRITSFIFLGFALLIVPWSVRNTRLQGVVTVVDAWGGITLRMGNYEHTLVNRAWDPATLEGDKSVFNELRAEHSEASSWTEGQKEKWAQNKALRYMVDHPVQTAMRSLAKIAAFWGLERTVIAGWQQKFYAPPRWVVLLGTIFIPLCYMAAMLLAALGIFLAAPTDYRGHLLIMLVIAFITGMHALTFGHERYHLPLMPLLLIYAASALRRQCWQRLSGELWRLAAPAVVHAVLVGIWLREILFLDAARIQTLLQNLFD